MGIDEASSIAHLATSSQSSPWCAAYRSRHQRSPGPVDTNPLPTRAKSAAMARLLRGLTISAVPVNDGSQAKVFPQGSAFVLGTKQTSTLQFGNNHVDEILATTG
jgi:hypothetical protein